MSKKISIFLGLLLGLVVVIGSINFIFLQRHINSVLSEDPRNEGIEVWVHYKWFIFPNEIKYDLRELSGGNSTADITRVLLQFAEKKKGTEYNKVRLAYKGKDKFYLEGSYFQSLGEDYSYQNPIYILRTLPENVYNFDGSRAYGVWTGGWLGVMGRQMEDLNQFAQDWYLKDAINDL